MSGFSLEQQVNLYQPILGAERRLFSARAIAVALAVFAVSLIGLDVYGVRRTASVEREVQKIERRAEADLALAERASQSLRPASSMAQLDAKARSLSIDIEERQRALDAVKRSSIAAATGFAARLEALARRHMDGLWLTTIIEGSGEGELAMRGAATDSRLVPAYLAALAEERALAGVRFDRIAMRHALPVELPAQVIFELDAPGLARGVQEPRK